MKSPWVWVVLALWLLGQALAMAHRSGHGGPGDPGVPMGGGPWAAQLHAEARTLADVVGGEHADGDVPCRLVDQAGLGEALASHAGALPLPLPQTGEATALAAWAVGEAVRRPYQARAPPRG